MSTSRTEPRVPLRLRRAERLRGRSEIESLFRGSRRAGGGGLVLLFRANGLDHNRFLVSTRRGFAGAVERNRERRRLREIYRQTKPRLRNGYDLAAVVAPPALAFAERSAQLQGLLEKAGLLLR